MFQVQYRLSGEIQDGTAVGVDVPRGMALDAAVESGSTVTAGDVLGKVTSTVADQGQAGTVLQSQQALIKSRVGVVKSPVPGVALLTSTTARIESVGLDVVVALQPLQQLRYRGMNFTGRASVETILGQRQVACSGVWIEDGSEPSNEKSAGGAASVHCRLPLDVETASGLPAVLTLTSDRVSDAIAVPLRYVGLDTTGRNYVVRVRDGAKVVQRPVVVAMTDGVRRVVASGLAAGEVLVPVSEQ